MDTFAGEVVDLFCGIGGLSHGFKRAGFRVVAGYDTDRRCRFGFESNNDASFYARDVQTLVASELKRHFSGSRPNVLAGCAPCQPFSTYSSRKDEDPRWTLVHHFSRLAAEVKTDFVTMENVPSLLRYRNGYVFQEFIQTLRNAGYDARWSIVKCESFGIPQRRRRLVVVASRNGCASEIAPEFLTVRTVRDAIGHLPPINAGNAHKDDKLHAAAGLSELNMMRIQYSRPGGSWNDWPESLRARCHQKKTGKTYAGVYGRMAWDQPAPTITTQCYGFGNGRFGHPVQNRAISLREAAILQSFPSNYSFIPDNEIPSFSELGRWIGNAVPVTLGEQVGRLFVNLIGSSH